MAIEEREGPGKVQVSPRGTKSPFVASLEYGEISNGHPTLESAVDSSARRLAIVSEGVA